MIVEHDAPAEHVGAAGDRFLDAARQAKEILASSEAEWHRLAPRIRVTDANALAIYRQRYGEGIVRRPIAEEEADGRDPRVAAVPRRSRRERSRRAASV